MKPANGFLILLVLLGFLGFAVVYDFASRPELPPVWVRDFNPSGCRLEAMFITRSVITIPQPSAGWIQEVNDKIAALPPCPPDHWMIKNDRDRSHDEQAIENKRLTPEPTIR